jgi:hypothetical protein
MKRQTIGIILLGILCVGCALFFGLKHGEKKTNINSDLPRMIAIGPISKGVTYTEQIGRHGFTMHAERISFAKTKTLGFENNLMKKLVATGVTITLTRGAHKRLEFSKDYIEMAPNMKTITIDHPTILSPANLRTIEKINIDKAGQTLTLFYGKEKKKEVWRLN